MHLQTAHNLFAEFKFKTKPRCGRINQVACWEEQQTDTVPTRLASARFTVLSGSSPRVLMQMAIQQDLIICDTYCQNLYQTVSFLFYASITLVIKLDYIAAVGLIQCTRQYSLHSLYISKELSSPTQFLDVSHGESCGEKTSTSL